MTKLVGLLTILFLVSFLFGCASEPNDGMDGLGTALGVQKVMKKP